MIGYREDGADVVGVYPLLPDGTCRFLVFDFDNHAKDAEKNDFANENLKSFHYYDRMYPSQDVSNSIGNLIALPLQGQALKNGNSAFVDENWNAYPDQWQRLFQIRKLSPEEVQQYIAKWQGELFVHLGIKNGNRPRPWNRQNDFIADDVEGKLHIVLADGVYRCPKPKATRAKSDTLFCCI